MKIFQLAIGITLLLNGVAFAQNGPIQDEVSFTNDIQPLVKEFCTTCHAGDDPEGDLLLTTYAEVRKQAEKGELLERINDAKDPMPEDGLMPQHFRRLFKRWAETGYLEKGTRPKPAPMKTKFEKFTPPKIKAIDLNKQGFEFLESLQGHWVGDMTLMGTKMDWMAFDYRPIAPSHIHGIFEGGSIGNLFTAFFIADYKGTTTIMARNGGLLNGIYRTSYFVLDKIQRDARGVSYRFVDAYGGAGIMSMELSFWKNFLTFKAYTSRLGLKQPQLHMSFQGERKRLELAKTAAKAVNFPQKVIDFRFPDPLPKPTWAEEYPLTSATYIAETPDRSLVDLGKESKDPRRIDQIPFLSQLKLKIERSEKTIGKKLIIYLTQKAITQKNGKLILQGGYIRADLWDTLLSFPELGRKTSDFTFTYLHPGDYYLTVIADMDENGFPSAGDITHPQTLVKVKPASIQELKISNLSVQN